MILSLDSVLLGFNWILYSHWYISERFHTTRISCRRELIAPFVVMWHASTIGIRNGDLNVLKVLQLQPCCVSFGDWLSSQSAREWHIANSIRTCQSNSEILFIHSSICSCSCGFGHLWASVRRTCTLFLSFCSSMWAMLNWICTSILILCRNSSVSRVQSSIALIATVDFICRHSPLAALFHLWQRASSGCTAIIAADIRERPLDSIHLEWWSS